jgi:hypothetical protein
MSQGEYGIPEIISFNGNCVLGANVNFTLFTIPVDLLTKLSDEAKKQMGKEIQEIIDKYAAIEEGWEEIRNTEAGSGYGYEHRTARKSP